MYLIDKATGDFIGGYLDSYEAAVKLKTKHPESWLFSYEEIIDSESPDRMYLVKEEENNRITRYWIRPKREAMAVQYRAHIGDPHTNVTRLCEVDMEKLLHRINTKSLGNAFGVALDVRKPKTYGPQTPEDTIVPTNRKFTGNRREVKGVRRETPIPGSLPTPTTRSYSWKEVENIATINNMTADQVTQLLINKGHHVGNG